MAEVKNVATRDSYGTALKELAADGADNLVVLDADLSAATKTGIFQKDYPNRHFNCGIAEANMVSVAAGLSTMGLVPSASSTLPASIASATIKPFAIIVTSLPSLTTSPLPISNL